MALLLLLPTALLLVAAGTAGFIYARNLLIEQWQEGAILKLERAAHYIDMRLASPADWIAMLQESSIHGRENVVLNFILDSLQNAPGVVNVDLNWMEGQLSSSGRRGRMHQVDTHRMLHQHRPDFFTVSPPEYDAEIGEETIALSAEITGYTDQLLGEVEVSMRFDYLLQDIKDLGWWESQVASLVDASGQYLAHSGIIDKERQQLGETNEPVELAILKKMQEETHGTHLGSGHPPELVAGFYSLEQAPWVLVLFAPGEDILAPVVEFRFYFALVGSICIILILVLIQVAGGRMVKRIQNVSKASEQVATGDYTSFLPVTAGDEIGQLENSFNTMIKGLQERDFIRDTFGKYMDKEIAEKLLQRPEATLLGGEKREVAILMSDLRDFTATADSLSPEQTIKILNRYFSRMIDIISKHKGIIVDFYGDGILVFFDPYEGPAAPTVDSAINCGLEMRNIMQAFQQELQAENLPNLQAGFAVHAGQVVVGNIGSKTRAKYGIVGSAVNTASRICEKAEAGVVLVSHSAYVQTTLKLENLKSFSTTLKGIKQEITVHAIS